MEYLAYHNEDFTDYSFTKSLKGSHIKQAAVIEANDLEDVFRVTNNIDHPWTENQEVKKVLTAFPRSLSVGDLVLDRSTDKLYVVEDCGYREITKDEYNELVFI